MALFLRVRPGTLWRGDRCKLVRLLAPRAITVSTDQLKEHIRHEFGSQHSLHDRLENDRLEKRKLRANSSAFQASELSATIAQVTRLTRRQEFNEAWAAFQSVERPDEALRHVALHLCAKARWWDIGWSIWVNTQVSAQDVVLYTKMLNLCGRCRRVVDAERFFQEMQHAAVVPNIITHTALINAHAMVPDPAKARKALAAIPEDVFVAARPETRGVTYLAVMNAYARQGDYAQARELFLEMPSRGVTPKLEHYTTLMAACADQEYGDVADSVFSIMVAAGLRPDVPAYTILLSCHRSNLRRCKELVDEMRRAELTPSPFTYQALLHAHVIAGDKDGATKLLQHPGLQKLRNQKKTMLLEERTLALP